MLTKKDNKFFRTIFGLKKHPVYKTFHAFSIAAGVLGSSISGANAVPCKRIFHPCPFSPMLQGVERDGLAQMSRRCTRRQMAQCTSDSGDSAFTSTKLESLIIAYMSATFWRFSLVS